MSDGEKPTFSIAVPSQDPANKEGDKPKPNEAEDKLTKARAELKEAESELVSWTGSG
jgi:hypothetical protein